MCGSGSQIKSYIARDFAETAKNSNLPILVTKDAQYDDPVFANRVWRILAQIEQFIRTLAIVPDDQLVVPVPRHFRVAELTDDRISPTFAFFERPVENQPGVTLADKVAPRWQRGPRHLTNRRHKVVETDQFRPRGIGNIDRACEWPCFERPARAVD